jgi:uncharacterized protein with beta-barrel porin domain
LKYLNFEHLGLDISAATTLDGGPWNFDLGITVEATGILVINQDFTSTTMLNSGAATFNGNAYLAGRITNFGNLTTGAELTTLSLYNIGTANFSGNANLTGGISNSGSLTNSGTLSASSLDNSGATKLSGSTTFTKKITNSGSFANTGALSGDSLESSGTANFSGNANFTGGISNSGSLTNSGTLSASSLDNSGATKLSGNTTFTGEIANSGSFANTGALSGDSLENSGTVNQDGNANLTGGISNSGSLTNSGTLSASSLDNSGAAKLSGRAEFTGNVTNKGTLIAKGRVSANNLINQGNTFISGTFSASSLTNTGYTSINGTANISRSTTNSGALNVNGFLNTGSLDNTGIISGTGVIATDLANQGMICPGNSIGTLTVYNSVTFEQGSVLEAELDSDFCCDLLKVFGPVTIKGGTIATRLPRVLYRHGASWGIISATQGIDGIFDSIDDQIDSQVLNLAQDTDDSTLRLVINRKSYGSFVAGGASDTGRNLDALVPLAHGEVADLLLSMDFDMDSQQIGQVLHALNPEMYTAFTAASLKAGSLFEQSIFNRLNELTYRQAFNLKNKETDNHPVQLAAATTITQPGLEQTNPQGWSFWGKGLGLWADKDGENGYLDRCQTTGGASLGADYMLSNWLILGLATGASNTNLSWNQHGYEGDINALHTGIYTQAGLEDFFALFIASYARLESSAKRPILFKDTTRKAEADFEADLYSAGLALGYQTRFGAWLLQPLAALDYQHLNEKGFSEKGAGFLNLDIANRQTDSLHSNLGFKLSRLCLLNEWKILPSLKFSWQHRFSDERPSLDANFTGYTSTPFTVQGADFNENTAIANLGLTASFTQKLHFFADYRLALADDYQEQALSAGLMVKF